MVAFDDVILDCGEWVSGEAFDEEVAHVVALYLVGIVGFEELIDELAETGTVGGD